ncbi:GNAT family N-acetyltransferase [Liquorilactobacillus satsumensis]|uniref:GNAT family N-acetyltransferase n=1 Tax=Liquorilactobacillus TaxID=2767888 RepID=UPI001E2AE00C|nr:GNAT family N-acetyltransferase [Liquorilactobacillus satsumensis]MCC7666220.1 N-acetyltransferase [Liquorilactobacillus satsumensis]MCP9327880.1 GNAT family N-acetyltransferase [Liquorilactobacillus satsumensis]MCP9358105.1 GNAT family N-acetyltransferase [Liquorilactobacillus satsumensis]MCP9371992.1 GNAT family N-acetyltransferase [Liquorilactobacillus satsumensis]
MQLIEYSETITNLESISNYQLTDLTYTGSPEAIISKSKFDSERKPIMIMDNEKLVGFFCLHLRQGPAQYGGNPDSDILIRAFSIDERYRHQHLAKLSMILVDDYVQQYYPEIKRLILAVNHANYAAQSVYRQAGFEDSGVRTYGKLGQQFIFCKKLIQK